MLYQTQGCINKCSYTVRCIQRKKPDLSGSILLKAKHFSHTLHHFKRIFDLKYMKSHKVECLYFYYNMVSPL